MKSWLRFLSYFWVSLWYLFAGLTVFVAAVFSLARIFLPMLNEHSATVEQYATELAGQPVKVKSLDAEWHGFGPSLVLNEVKLLDKSGKTTLVTFDKARLGFGLIETIKAGQVSFNYLGLAGAELTLVRNKEGNVSISGFDWVSSSESAQISDEAFLSRWLLSQGRIGLELKKLNYVDRMVSNKTYRFNGVFLELKNSFGRHLIEAELGIPKHPEQKLKLSVDTQGDILHSSNWSGRVYVKGTGIHILDLLNSLELFPYKIQTGRSDFELWTLWKSASLEDVRGDFSFSDIDINMTGKQAGTKQNLSYEQVKGRVSWNRSGSSWRLGLDKLVIDNMGRRWPEAVLTVDSYLVDNQQRLYSVAGSFLRIEDLLPLTIFTDLRDQQVISAIDQSKLRADVYEYNFRMTPATGQFRLLAQVDSASANAYEAIPEFENISAYVDVDQDKGYAKLDTSNAWINFPRVFRGAWPINNLSGEISWQHDAKSIYVNGRQLELDNDDLRSEGIFDIEIPSDGGSPFLNLIVEFDEGDLTQGSRYFPVSVMPEGLVKWLDKSLLGGVVTVGGAVFHGRLADFPFDKGDGVFEVQFNTEEAIFKYADNWPVTHDATASVLFRGKTMKVDITSGKIFSNDIENMSISTLSLGAEEIDLTITGDVRGATSDKLKYMVTAPQLKEKFGAFAGDLTAQGDSDLHLDISLSIGKTIDSEVAGTLKFENNKISNVTTGNIFSQANGSVDIVPGGLEARGIKTQFFGQPSVIDIKTVAYGQKPRAGVEIKAKGRFDSKDLSARYLPVLNDLVDGRSNWTVSATVPTSSSINENSQPIIFSAQTQLKGVQVNLPTPFSKAAKERLDFRLNGQLFPGRKYVINTKYGKRFDGIFEITEDEDLNNFRGEIRFGGGHVVLPSGHGFRLLGQLDNLSIDVWRSLVNQIVTDKTSRSVGRTYDIVDLLHSADLTINNFELFGQKTGKMSLLLLNTGNELIANVSSKELHGEIKVPRNLQRDPIEMELDNWVLTSSSGASSAIDPRDFPSIKGYAKSVMYKNRKFGSVRLVTTKLAEGLRVEQLQVKPRATNISAYGKWIVHGGKQNSQFELYLDSTNLGATMNDLGYLNSIAEGAGSLTANITWDGPLPQADINHLNGQVSMNFTEGRLLEIDPGAGRIFGLFSLQNLPRRLLLDFSDLFEDGVRFNSISGEFRIDGGDAYTNNFAMDGPGGKALLAGRIGLASQDYDQLLTFTPQSADIASLIGLIVATPWAVILPQIFKDDINKAMSVQYTLSGDWVAPKMEAVLVPEELEEES